MAQFLQSKELEQMIDKLERMHADEEVFKKMCTAAQDIMYPAILKGAQKHEVTKKMVESLHKRDPVKINDIWYGNLRFAGTDKIYVNKTKRKTYITNWLKAFRIEYGTSDQKAQPFVTPAIAEVENKINEKLQEIYDEEIKKLQ